jgi:hypothetical protein
LERRAHWPRPQPRRRPTQQSRRMRRRPRARSSPTRSQGHVCRCVANSRWCPSGTPHQVKAREPVHQARGRLICRSHYRQRDQGLLICRSLYRRSSGMLGEVAGADFVAAPAASSERRPGQRRSRQVMKRAEEARTRGKGGNKISRSPVTQRAHGCDAQRRLAPACWRPPPRAVA